MTATPHDECIVCRYWQDSIDTSRVRALRGVEAAFKDERQARRELAEHLARSHGRSQ